MNENNFPSLVITNVRYLRDSVNSSRSFVVPGKIYGSGSDRVTSFGDALEVLFRELNVVDGNELISDPDFRFANPSLRSMSVGDVVTFRGPAGLRKDYVCEGLGWKEVSRDEADWIVKNISARDFWGTFATTKKAFNKEPL
jgi:hypothetical protein